MGENTKEDRYERDKRKRERGYRMKMRKELFHIAF
jgi:hypothetical protein